ncbi:MAG: metal-dependent hydrolase [Bacteroidia bacterium]
MDSLTQIVLGAGVAELTLGKKIGNKALMWGAIIGTIPDLDVLGRFWQSEYHALLSHRAGSHAIFTFIFLAPALGWLLHRLYKGKDGTTFKDWTIMAWWVLLTHTLLDCFTTWGTQLFWPFDHTRVAFNSIFVVDPLYTVPFLICLIVVMFKKRESKARNRWKMTGIVLSTLYLLLTLVNKAGVDKVIEHNLREQGISTIQYSTYPSPLNNVLWYGVAEGPYEYHVGYYSLLDSKSTVTFRSIPKNHALIPYEGNTDFFTCMEWVSQGYHQLEKRNDTLLWHDLRFGLIEYGMKPDSAFDYPFTYKLIEENGKMVDIAQDQPNNDNLGEAFGALWERIKGN